MTKQEIIDLFCEIAYDEFNGDLEWTIGKHADTLLAKIEQEKKEQAIDILKKIIAILQEEADGGNYAIGVRALAEDCEAIAKEYGVEL